MVQADLKHSVLRESNLARAERGVDGAPLAAETIVAVQGLTKVFRDFWMRPRAKAVNNVSFEIRRGEIFGLLGPNGSGKSTTIKIVLGLLHKTFGRIAVFGKLPTDVAVKRRIGYLPEESYLYPFLNARETLDYYGKLFQLDSQVRKRRIDELLDMVGLASVQFRQVREYSKGMQRRIGLAQALINDPELLILDEPTTGLDPIGTRQVKDLIIELGRRGKTVLLSSHLLADVEDCVDRMVILYGGKVQTEGTCDELLESRDRTVIEADTLDEQTISAIDRLIRERSGGANAITRVARPRQKLEDLFVGIVDRAIAERQETSGAMHGGATASFLKAEPEQGEALVASLLAAGASSVVPAAGTELTATPEPAKVPAGPDRDVLGGLIAAARPPVPTKSPEPSKLGHSAVRQPAPDADEALINSLLDPGGNAAGQEPRP